MKTLVMNKVVFVMLISTTAFASFLLVSAGHGEGKPLVHHSSSSSSSSSSSTNKEETPTIRKRKWGRPPNPLRQPPPYEALQKMTIPQFIQKHPTKLQQGDKKRWLKAFAKHPEIISGQFHDHDTVPAKEMVERYNDLIAFNEEGGGGGEEEKEKLVAHYALKANTLLKNHLRLKGASKEYLHQISLHTRRRLSSRFRRQYKSTTLPPHDGADDDQGGEKDLASASTSPPPLGIEGEKMKKKRKRRRDTKPMHELIEDFKQYMLTQNIDPDKLSPARVEIESRKLYPYYNHNKKEASEAMSRYLNNRGDDQNLIDAAKWSRGKFNDVERKRKSRLDQVNDDHHDDSKVSKGKVTTNQKVADNDIHSFSQEPWWNEAFKD